ncbi:MAG TPA: Hsp20/alpha crystallin family protein [Gaiellaceae bacterium]|nr:Hsp20/alpha crystallin family protein [Gaiellaceae bacterium]
MAGRRRHVGDLQGEIQELFAELWQVPRFSGLRHGFRPQCDCYRTDDPPALHVVVELPGVDPASVEVAVAERALVVAGSRQRPQLSGARYHQVEIEYGPFERRLELPDDVDTAGATARYENGMLQIELPLAQRPPRSGERISIEVRRR